MKHWLLVRRMEADIKKEAPLGSVWKSNFDGRTWVVDEHRRRQEGVHQMPAIVVKDVAVRLLSLQELKEAMTRVHEVDTEPTA